MTKYRQITEEPSPYHHLEQLPVFDILTAINQEDTKVAQAITIALPQVEKLVNAIIGKMREGGRLFYIGAGTSGRLGVVDASECPPTFGVEPGRVMGIIAGGPTAMFRAVEFAEDNTEAGWRDLLAYEISSRDIVIGISASGTTPYVTGALKACNDNDVVTGSISNNPGAPMSEISKFPVEVVTGPEFVTGSTRMKSGSSQKMVLNMISTAVMIRLGLVEDNKMVNMQLTNNKLLNRGTRMLMEETGETDYETAKKQLLHFGSVKKALGFLK